MQNSASVSHCGAADFKRLDDSEFLLMHYVFLLIIIFHDFF